MKNQMHGIAITATSAATSRAVTLNRNICDKPTDRLEWLGWCGSYPPSVVSAATWPSSYVAGGASAVVCESLCVRTWFSALLCCADGFDGGHVVQHRFRPLGWCGAARAARSGRLTLIIDPRSGTDHAMRPSRPPYDGRLCQ